MDVSPDYLLGYRPTSAPDIEILQCLAHRPDDLAHLRGFKTLVERIMPIIDRHRLNPNEKALSGIVPPPMIRGQRRIAAVRLREMQRELAAVESTNHVPGRQVEVGRTI